MRLPIFVVFVLFGALKLVLSSCFWWVKCKLTPCFRQGPKEPSSKSTGCANLKSATGISQKGGTFGIALLLNEVSDNETLRNSHWNFKCLPGRWNSLAPKFDQIFPIRDFKFKAKSRRVPPCAVKTCALRPVFARVVGELWAAHPSNLQRPVKAKC